MASVKKTTPESQLQDSGVVCLDVSSNDTSSGGGIRTPDTRIMIPNSETPNPLVNSEKQQLENGVYTPVYTRDAELQYVVNSWGSLSEDARRAIVQIVNVLGK
ncbi:hypothetical protein Mal35_27180 [Gimesia maris]|uniref:hypothetical protein n=1 Tax=Gimesia maris TaxID=122 RepID=UPI00118C6259|nr:hypothetical protein [Gimesia maris]QDT79263.1 hypothetical protein Mal35_27180 [Gimesia maris]